MIRLNEFSYKSEYQGLSLECCGLLFLSSPHSGTTEADWNDFLIGVAKITYGIRPGIISSLRSFNHLSTDSQEQFANLKVKLPFDAFYETSKTKIAGLNRLVCFLDTNKHYTIDH